jgi:2-polyprenyl-6-hydroxyphenyl methylase/3-demethylubiquinone-9 3-methyltransferase
MSIGTVRALRILHRAFGRYPLRHRLHILIRFFSCPFLRTIDDIPRDARVLEIGSGHGLYARLITEERAREVIAVDPDLRKSLLRSPSPRIRKVAAYDEAVRGEFDAVVIYDATYRMPLDVRRALFARVFDRLLPGGTFVFKDMDGGHRWKMKWARFQEWLSDTFLHISIGEGFIYQSRDEVAAMLGELGFADFRARPIDRGYPHPHIIYTARKPEAQKREG